MLAKNFQIIQVSYLGSCDARGHGTHLADDEERVGSVVRERPCSASVPNPCGENQADGTKVALKRSDRHKLTLQGSLVSLHDVPPSSSCIVRPAKASMLRLGCRCMT